MERTTLLGRLNGIHRKQKGSSAVGFAAVADTGDLDDVVVFGLKQDPIVSATEPEIGAWRLDFFSTSPVRVYR